MKHSRLLVLLPLAAFLLGTIGLRGAEPSPTPRPAARRKLGGGRFGAPPSATPTPLPDGGSSLAGAVRKTQDEDVSASKRSRGIVITNETLRRREPAPKSDSITITGTSGSAPTIKVPATPTPGTDVIPEYKDASGQTEAQWKVRSADARARVEKADADLEGAQAEVRRLENDFYAWSDGNYRERVIRPAWDQAKARLQALETEAAAAREALSGLEEEARKSGTPPGWLR